MLKSKHKLLELKTKTLVDSLFIWNYKTKLKWRGIEFADYKEYDYTDNVKNIDFIKSAKEWKTLVKLYEEERELSVYILVDLDESFFYDINHVKKIDIVYEIFYMLWLSTIKWWDKFWALVYNDYKKKLHIARKWKQNFINVVNSIEDFNEIEESSFFGDLKNMFKIKVKKEEIRWLKYFNSLKVHNKLVFLFTDQLDKHMEDLKVLWVKNDLVVCNIFSSFENTLDAKWLKWFNHDWENMFIDLDNEKKQEYVELRKKKLEKFRKKVIKCGARYLYIDETTDIFKKFSILFKI